VDERTLFTGFWTSESRATRNVLARIPEGSDYRPDPKSRTAQEIAWQIVCEEKMLIDALESGKAEWAPPPTPPTMKAVVEIPFSKATQRTLQLAAEEADRLSHPHIGVEHLLLGILRENDDVAAPLLSRHGVKLGGVRTAIETMLAESPDVERPPGEIATRAADEIDQLKASIETLGTLSADSSEASAIRKSIHDRLEGLKRFFRS